MEGPAVHVGKPLACLERAQAVEAFCSLPLPQARDLVTLVPGLDGLLAIACTGLNA